MSSRRSRGLTGFDAENAPRRYLRPIHHGLLSALVAPRSDSGPRAVGDDAARLVLAKWRYFPCHCHDFRFYVTLFPKCFSNFRSRYLFDIGLPTLYLTLADKYLPLDTAFPSSATLLERPVRHSGSWLNGLPPSLAQYSHEGLCSAGFALHIEFRQSHTNHNAA